MEQSLEPVRMPQSKVFSMQLILAQCGFISLTIFSDTRSQTQKEPSVFPAQRRVPSVLHLMLLMYSCVKQELKPSQTAEKVSDWQVQALFLRLRHILPCLDQSMGWLQQLSATPGAYMICLASIFFTRFTLMRFSLMALSSLASPTDRYEQQVERVFFLEKERHLRCSSLSICRYALFWVVVSGVLSLGWARWSVESPFLRGTQRSAWRMVCLGIILFLFVIQRLGFVPLQLTEASQCSKCKIINIRVDV